MLLDFTLGQTSIVLRVKLRQDATGAKPGQGMTGLTSASSGLIISTIADNEATATTYTSSASHVQTIATLGTFAAPSASNCRFQQVDSTNHPGIYELQIDNSRFAVSSSKSLMISISGVTGLADCDVLVPLRSVNPYSANAFITGVNSLAPPTNWNLDAIDASGRRDVGKWLGNAVTVDANSVPNVSVKYVGGTLQTARDLGTSVLLSVGTGTGQVNLTSGKVPATLASTDVTGNVSADVQTIKTQTVTCSAGVTIGAFVGNATAAIAIDASGRVDLGKILGTASQGAAGYVGPDWGHVNAPTATVNLSGTTISTSQAVASVSGAVASVTAAVSLSTNDSPVVQSGTAQAGAASTITLSSGASATDHMYEGQTVKTTGGTGPSQVRVITGYVGSTKVATVDRAWQTAPDVTTTYAVLATDHPKTDSSLQVTASGITGTAFPTNFASLSIDGSGRIDVGKTLGTAVTLDTNNVLNVSAKYLAGTALTGRDIGSSVLLSAGTSAGQLDFTSGVVKANLVQILATALTETAGQIAGGFKKFFNIATPASTMDALTLVATATTVTNTVTTDVTQTTRAEPGQGAPGATITLAAKIDYIYKSWRNKKTQTASVVSLFADDATTVDQKGTISDDGTTLTTGEIGAGP